MLNDIYDCLLFKPITLYERYHTQQFQPIPAVPFFSSSLFSFISDMKSHTSTSIERSDRSRRMEATSSETSCTYKMASLQRRRSMWNRCDARRSRTTPKSKSRGIANPGAGSGDGDLVPREVLCRKKVANIDWCLACPWSLDWWSLHRPSVLSRGTRWPSAPSTTITQKFSGWHVFENEMTSLRVWEIEWKRWRERGFVVEEVGGRRKNLRR